MRFGDLCGMYIFVREREREREREGEREKFGKCQMLMGTVKTFNFFFFLR
jgi:hypothetical protein